MTKQEFEALIDKRAQELAGKTDSINDVECPRSVMNPGLYIGFILGARQAFELMKSEIEYVQWNKDGWQNKAAEYWNELEKLKGNQ